MSVKNPLLVDVVLCKIFEKLSLDSLLAARLVCKQWRDLSTFPYFQDAMLRRNRELELTLNNWPAFKSTFGDSRRVYWRRLALHAVPINELNLNIGTYGPFLSNLTLLTYYQESGSMITLDSFRFLFSSIPFLEQLTLEALPNEISACNGPLFQNQQQELQQQAEPFLLPHLRKLCLYLKSLSYSQSFFHGLFSSAPNLESLTIRDTNSNFQLIVVILQALGGNFTKLKSFQVVQLNEVCLQILNSYSEQGMRLKELYLENLSADVLHFTIFTLMNRQSSTLELLLIGRPTACRSVFLNFNFTFFMPHLKTLDFWTHSLDWSNIQYTRQLPQLQTVILRAYRSFHNWSTPLPNPDHYNDSPCSSVRNIVWLDDFQTTDGSTNLWKTYILFPFVKSVVIKMCWDFKILETLWSLWSNLEELEVHLDAEMHHPDMAFTGIHPDDCVDILRRKDMESLRYAHSRASIGRFRGLKKLRIYQNYNSSPLIDVRNEITDITGYTIKLNLENLEELVISKRSMISPVCRNELQQMPNIKNIVINSRLQ